MLEPNRNLLNDPHPAHAFTPSSSHSSYRQRTAGKASRVCRRSRHSTWPRTLGVDVRPELCVGVVAGELALSVFSAQLLRRSLDGDLTFGMVGERG